jgi:Family of unknown function (DUF5954)
VSQSKTSRRRPAALATYLALSGPAAAASDREARAAYAAAITVLEHQRPVHLTVAGRHSQVIRVEQIMRLCDDGPEPARTPDYDPDLPAETHTADRPPAG